MLYLQKNTTSSKEKYEVQTIVGYVLLWKKRVTKVYVMMMIMKIIMMILMIIIIMDINDVVDDEWWWLMLMIIMNTLRNFNRWFPLWGLTNRRFETHKTDETFHQGKVHVSQIHIDAALPYSRLTKSDKQKNCVNLKPEIHFYKSSPMLVSSFFGGK